MGTELVKVGFQGGEIEAVRDGADVWVSVRRVCEALGLQPDAQRKRLGRSRWARTSIMDVQVGGQSRQVFMVDLDTLPMWLATIDAGRVSAVLRPRLDSYQRECARVLRDHFFGARNVTSPPASLPAIAGIVRDDAALLRDLRRLVGACSRMTLVSERRVRGWMVKVSGAASYFRMPLAYAAFVREQLMRVALGEDAAPWSQRRALPAATGQQVFPPPVGPAQA